MEKSKLISYVIWGVALLAMIMSLIFSEIMKFPPCSLCWYQRVFIYPLVFILPIGIVRNDKSIFTYSMVLSFIGLLISSYHSLIYHGVVQEALKLCNSELSCKTKQFEFFDFLSIPVMSFFSFLIIFILSIIGEKNGERN